jgi:hypothetical protein
MIGELFSSLISILTEKGSAMQSNTPEWRMLINEAAYSLIREQAPDELPVYLKTRDRYFADPAGFTAQASSIDRPLGIGPVEVLQTFSTTIFPLLTPILVAIATAVAAALQQEASDHIVAEVRKLFAKPEPILTQAQLDAIAVEIGTVVRARQKQLDLDPTQAQAVSDAIIARLALAKKA